MQEHGRDVVALNCGTGMDMERARPGGGPVSQGDGLPVDGAAERGAAEAGEYEGGV